MLLEIRSTNSYTVVPPSTWVDKAGQNPETIIWHSERDPARIDKDIAYDLGAQIASATLLAMNWPDSGTRHAAIGPLVGFLCGAGIEPDQAIKLVMTAAEVAGDSDLRDRDVVGVSWFDAVAYCEWRSGQDGRVVRLPTEAKWEIAASGGQDALMPRGDEIPAWIPNDGPRPAGGAVAGDARRAHRHGPVRHHHEHPRLVCRLAQRRLLPPIAEAESHGPRARR